MPTRKSISDSGQDTCGTAAGAPGEESSSPRSNSDPVDPSPIRPSSEVLNRRKQETERARNYVEAILRTTRTPFIVLRDDLRVDRANEAFCKTFKISRADVEGRLIFELEKGAWDLPPLRKLLEEIIPQQGFLHDVALTQELPRTGRRRLLVNARQMEREDSRRFIFLSIEDVTETMECCAVTQRSEIRFRRLFEAAKDGILILDPNSRKITDANPFVAQFFGCTPAELLGKELWEIGVFKDREATDAAFLEMQEKCCIRGENLVLEAKDGRRREAEFVSNLYEEGGHRVIQCHIRDITARKRAEEELRRSQQTLTDFIENASVAMHWVGPDGRILWANRPELELLGYKRDEYVGHHLAEFHADQRVIEDILRRLTNHETLQDYEARLRRKDGSIREVLITSNVLWEGDKFIHTRCFTQDITDRKRAEETLRESEERFHSMADNIAPLAWMADATGSIFWCNKRWFDYTGRTLAETQGWGWKTVVHPEDLQRVVERVRHCLDTGEVWEDTFRLRSKEGAYRWFLSRAFPIRAADGGISRWFGTNTDITELRETQEALQKSQDELRQHADSLARTVAERTASLRETVGELEGYSYSIAHDMRAPLRSMRAYSEILLAEYAGTLDKRAIDYLERIMRSSNRLDELIRDVLNYGKILSVAVVNEPVNLDRLLRDILDTYPDYQPPRAQIEIEGTIPMVLGNEALLTQCISNLLSNAVKFVAADTIPRIRIRAEINGPVVRLCIQDNGIGIAPVNHARIFRMFDRIHPATEYDGTGIGLTIARKAARRMGGEIEFVSEPGKGSTFWIELRTPTDSAASPNL